MKVGKDPQRCVVEYEHMKSNRTTDRDLWGYLKKRDMKGLYPEDKIEVLVEKRTSQTWFVDDEDFTTFAYLCCIVLLCFALLCFAPWCMYPCACILVRCEKGGGRQEEDGGSTEKTTTPLRKWGIILISLK